MKLRDVYSYNGIPKSLVCVYSNPSGTFRWASKNSYMDNFKYGQYVKTRREAIQKVRTIFRNVKKISVDEWKTYKEYTCFQADIQ